MSSDKSQDLDPRIADLVEQAMQEVREEFLRRLEETRSRIESAVREVRKTDAEADDEMRLEETFDDAAGEIAEERDKRLDSVFAAVAAIDRARSQSGVLIALLEGAAGFASRAAFLVAEESGLTVWSAQGFEHDESRSVGIVYSEGSPWWQFTQGRGTLAIDTVVCAELCEQLGGQRPDEGLLVPMVLRDRLAGGLYADSLADALPLEATALQLLTYVASQALETLPLRDRNSTSTLRLAADAPVEEEALELLSTLLGTGRAQEDPAAREDLKEEDLASGDPAEEEAEPDPQDLEESAAEDEGIEEYEQGGEEAAEIVPEETIEESLDETSAALPGDAAHEVDDTETLPVETDTEQPHDDVELLPWQTESVLEATEQPEPEGIGTAGADIDAAPEPLDEASSESAAFEPFAAEPTEAEPTEAEPTEAEPTEAESVAAADPTPPQGEGDEHPAIDVDTLAEPPRDEPETSQPETSQPETAADPQEVIEDNQEIEAPPAFESTEVKQVEAPPAFESTEVKQVEAPPAFESTEVRPPEDVDGPGWAFDQSEEDVETGEDNSQHEEARRLARLLVTEIKLYNEDAVEEGLQNGNIMQSLRNDIDRSRLIYLERTSEEVRAENDYFQDELVRILAGGDADALGT